MAKAASHLLLLRRLYASAAAKTTPTLRCRFCSASAANGPLSDRFRLLTEKPSSLTPDGDLDDLRPKIASLARDILALSDEQDLAGVLESRSAVDLLRRSPDGSASVMLLSYLHLNPKLALEVFAWRTKLTDETIPVQAEEYTKAIALAGLTKDVELAAGLFYDAVSTHSIRGTSLYNALMSAYMYNGCTRKAISVFQFLREDPVCRPTIATYNILISVYGRSMLINSMESVLEMVRRSEDLTPTLLTYNTVISSYVTAWEWDKMESTFREMEDGPIKPDSVTYTLMLRGYVHAGKIEKMEKMYEMVKEQVNQDTHLVRAMIVAYCKSSDPDRVSKVENLMKLVPEEEYMPWLNVLLIRLYAEESMVESMDRLIVEAFKRNTAVTTTGIMRSIIASYFRCDAVNRLAEFVREAEYAGWSLCRSLYHCKMVMYGERNRLQEMHAVLDEMEAYQFSPTKKTFIIMFKAYSKIGRRSEAESIYGTMCKHGFCMTDDTFILR